MEEEIWKDIKGYEGLYQISSFGYIKSFKRYKEGKILRQAKYSNGYLFVHLRPMLNGQKSQMVHRLVAETFIPNPNNYPYVNHKNGNKQDNTIENLEWCTQSYNLKHALDIGLIDSQCKIKRKVWLSKGNEQLEFTDMKSCCRYFGFTKCWLGNYSRKHGNPCWYNGYTILIEKRGDANGVR